MGMPIYSFKTQFFAFYRNALAISRAFWLAGRCQLVAIHKMGNDGPDRRPDGASEPDTVIWSSEMHASDEFVHQKTVFLKGPSRQNFEF